VMVQGAGSKFLVGPSASGYIRGTILLQSSSSFTLQSTTLQTVAPGGMITGPTFGILYSCDAIDLVFGALPLKVVGSSESSF